MLLKVELPFGTGLWYSRYISVFCWKFKFTYIANLKCSNKIDLNPLQIANHRPVSISIFMIWSWFRRMASNVGCQTNSKTTGKPSLKSHDFSIGLELKNNQKYFKVHFIIFIGYHCYSWSRGYVYLWSKIRKKNILAFNVL